MADATVVLGQTRLWACSQQSQWAGLPAADDGPVCGVAPVPALLAEVFASVLAGLGMRCSASTQPTCRRLTVVIPSHWGTGRLAAVAAAGRAVAEQVAVQQLALRAVRWCGSDTSGGGGDTAGGEALVAVLELGAMTTTATLVARSDERVWVAACEHEPNVGAVDLDDDPEPAARTIAELVARVVVDRRCLQLLVVDCAEPTRLAARRSAIAAACGDGRAISVLCAEQLAREMPHTATSYDTAQRDERPRRGAPPRSNTAPHREPVRNGAVPLWEARRRRTKFPASTVSVVAATALVGVAIVTGTVVTHYDWRPGPPAGNGAGLRASATGGAASRVANAAGSAGGAVGGQLRMVGRVGLRIPTGWHALAQAGSRLDVVPDDGARQRLTVVQRQLTSSASLDDVARDLNNQIAGKDPDRMSGFRTDASFGDRRGLAYEEHPGDGTTVTWHVLAVAGLQVSVGCQSDSSRGQLMASVCDRFVRDVVVDP